MILKNSEKTKYKDKSVKLYTKFQIILIISEKTIIILILMIIIRMNIKKVWWKWDMKPFKFLIFDLWSFFNANDSSFLQPHNSTPLFIPTSPLTSKLDIKKSKISSRQSTLSTLQTWLDFSNLIISLGHLDSSLFTMNSRWIVDTYNTRQYNTLL